MKFFISLVVALIWAGVHGCSNDGSLKSVGEKCEADVDCYNGGTIESISCQSGLCTCNEGYVAQMQWSTPKVRRLVCIFAPFQFQPCNSICQNPFTCAISSTPGIKTCQCLPPAIVKDGQCVLECKSDEVFQGGSCRRRCSKDEVKDQYICKKVGLIGHKCDNKNQCSAPFSQCMNGVCSCVDGFTPNSKNDACESTYVSCPIGSPIRTSDNKIVECRISKRRDVPGLPDIVLPFPRSDFLQDNCGHDQFCMVTSGESFYADGSIGHCCPKPMPKCPIGLQHPNASCGVPIPNKDGIIPFSQYCPYGTHSCIRFTLGGGFDESLCCPIACGINQVFHNGVCYPKRDWGDQCETSDQCRGHYGICENGKCTCGKDYVDEVGIGYHFCRRVCKDNEVLADSDRCLPKLNLEDKCDPQLSSQCPAFAYCSSEKRICDCLCGYVRLDGDSCGPQPICPDIQASNNPVLLDSMDNSTTISLCHIPNRPRSSVSPAVDTCPMGQYCSSYVPEYGLCCPKPEKPFCPNGATPGEKCDPKEPNACGLLGSCSRYLNPADSESEEGYVCCPVLPPIFNVNINDTLPIGPLAQGFGDF